MARGDDASKRRRGSGLRSATPGDDKDRATSRSPKRSRHASRSRSPAGRRRRGGGGGGGDDAGGPALVTPLDIAAATADAYVGLADKAAGLPPDVAAPAPPTSRVARTVAALLDVKNGSWASARLAARLLPPLIARVPSHMEAAVSLLIRLADGRVDALWPQHPQRALPPLILALAESAAADAVASLGRLVAGSADLPPADPALQKAVAYLLARWAADPRSAPGRDGELWEEHGPRAGASQPGGAAPEPEEGETAEAPADARSALRAAFRGNPRAVLRGVAAAAGSGRPADAGAAEAAVRGVLLRADPHWVTPSDGATDAAADAATGMDPVAARRMGAAGAPDPPPSLAAAVLGPGGGAAARAAHAWLEAETAGGGGGGGGGRAGGRLLRQVLGAVPAVTVQGGPAAGAGRGGGATPAGAAAAAAGPAAATAAGMTAPASATPIPTVIGSTLRLAPLPAAATTADVTAACARHASVLRVRLVTTAGGGGVAEVECADVPAAALVYEALAGACPPPWWGRAGGKGASPAVDARFVGEDPPPAAGPACVWAPRIRSDAGLSAAMAALRAAGCDPPSGTLRVAGREPCVIFQFGDGGRARAAAAALASAAAAADGAGGTGLGGFPSLPSSSHPATAAAPSDLLLAAIPPGAGYDDYDAAAGGGAGAWSGALAKGGVTVVEGLACLDGPAPAAPPGSAGSAEPVAWPATLDMTFRVDAAFVLQAVLDSAPPDTLTVRRLALEPGAPRGARAAFINFLNELASRRRAGVVELPGPGGAGGGFGGPMVYAPGAPPPARRLYLVPPSNSVAARLGVEWSPNECVFVVVVAGAPE